MRLIDADRLLVRERFESVGNEQYERVGFVYLDDIKNAPTIGLDENEIKKRAEDEVWEFAKRIICPSDCCDDSISRHTKEIFGKEGWETRGIFVEMTYQEAKAKYNAWKNEKEQIRVGDEVALKDGNFKYIVMGFHFNTAYLLASDGSVSKFPVNKLRKLNKHFNEMEELLKKMEELLKKMKEKQ